MLGWVMIYSYLSLVYWMIVFVLWDSLKTIKWLLHEIYKFIRNTDWKLVLKKIILLPLTMFNNYF